MEYGQAESNINKVLNSERITEEDKTLFYDSIKAIIGYGINPSIKMLWDISELPKTDTTKSRLYKLIHSDRVVLSQTLHIKPCWATLSNGQMIKSRYATISRFIQAVN